MASTKNIMLNSKRMNVFPYNWEPDKYVHSHHSYSTSSGGPSQSKEGKRNKRYTDWKGRNKTVPIHREHDPPQRKAQQIYKNILK
jgi:hypothetical protein